MDITIGTDFEIPLIDKESNPISAIGIIGGSKSRPLSIGNGCARQEDNVMSEWTIPPCLNFEDFTGFINYCIEKGEEFLEPYGLKFNYVSSAEYSDEELDTASAMEFGCEPSFNAYTRDFSHRPTPKEVGNLRTAGFHIHIGLDIIHEDVENREESVVNLIKLMDLYLGVPSILLDPDERRREIYGNAGDFRFKGYGAEYRTLGTGMMATFNLLEFIWENTKTSVDHLIKGIFVNDDRVPTCIDNSDKKLAQDIINDYGIVLPKAKVYAL